MALDYGTRYYKLAGVKECLYHPRLPTFRRIDMDTIAHKLPHEHCRTTTPCSKGNKNNFRYRFGAKFCFSSSREIFVEILTEISTLFCP